MSSLMFATHVYAIGRKEKTFPVWTGICECVAWKRNSPCAPTVLPKMQLSPLLFAHRQINRLHNKQSAVCRNFAVLRLGPGGQKLESQPLSLAFLVVFRKCLDSDREFSSLARTREIWKKYFTIKTVPVTLNTWNKFYLASNKNDTVHNFFITTLLMKYQGH
jgi:hypothetical protein